MVLGQLDIHVQNNCKSPTLPHIKKDNEKLLYFKENKKTSKWEICKSYTNKGLASDMKRNLEFKYIRRQIARHGGLCL